MSETSQKLNAWNMSDGSVQVHAVGCSHKPGSGKSKAQHQEQVEFGQIAWLSQHAFAHDYWDNGILDEHEAEHGAGSFDVFVEMDFKPCVTIPKYSDQEVTEMADAKADKATKPAKPAKDLPGKAPNEVPPPRSSKSKALPGGKCRCGCGAEVGRTSTFAQGHDARFVSKLVQEVVAKRMTREAAIVETTQVSDALTGKLTKALDNAVTSAASKAEAAKAKAEKAEKAAAIKAAQKAKTQAAKDAKDAKPVDEADEGPTSGVDEDDESVDGDVDIEDTGEDESGDDDDF
jgi:hypothetical protein